MYLFWMPLDSIFNGLLGPILGPKMLQFWVLFWVSFWICCLSPSWAFLWPQSCSRGCKRRPRDTKKLAKTMVFTMVLACRSFCSFRPSWCLFGPFLLPTWSNLEPFRPIFYPKMDSKMDPETVPFLRVSALSGPQWASEQNNKFLQGFLGVS